MQNFSNPLDKIKIASPCGADWNDMIGDERKRYCAECKLNVYNLSQMTREEAEIFLIKSEGRVCLRVFRRDDGTVLTQDCRVGLQMFKKKISRKASAVFALIAGFLGGIFSFESLKPLRLLNNSEKVSQTFSETESRKNSDETNEVISFGGMLNNLPEIKAEIFKSRSGF